MDLAFNVKGYNGRPPKEDLVVHYNTLLAHNSEIAEAARDPKGATGPIPKVTRRKDDWGHIRETALALVPFVVFNLSNEWPGLSLRDCHYAAANRYAYRMGFDQEATPESVEAAIRAFFARKWPDYFSSTGLRLRRPISRASLHLDRNDLVLSAQLYYLLEDDRDAQGKEQDDSHRGLDEVIEKYLRKGIEWELERRGSSAFERVKQIVEELS